MRYPRAADLPWPRRFLPWRDPDAHRERRWHCPGHQHPSQEHHLSYGVRPEVGGAVRGWTYDSAEKCATMYEDIEQARGDIRRRLRNGCDWTEVLANYDPASTDPTGEADAFQRQLRAG